jgi:hypothetical protein
MSKVLGIICRTISMYLIKKIWHSKKTVRTGAVTLIQRFIAIDSYRVADIVSLTHKISWI